MTSRPAAWSAFALASTLSVADSAIELSLFDRAGVRGEGALVVTPRAYPCGPCGFSGSAELGIADDRAPAEPVLPRGARGASLGGWMRR
jgi:hypothetical protein